MARLWLFGSVAGDDRREWKSTQIHASGGGWGVEVYRVPGWVRRLMEMGAATQERFVSELSPLQKHKTSERLWRVIESDPDSAAASGSLTAFERDLEIFGDSAFTTQADGPAGASGKKHPACPACGRNMKPSGFRAKLVAGRASPVTLWTCMQCKRQFQEDELAMGSA